jgi:RNA polymerase sigma-70 factor (ECF subfamily)
LRGHHAELLRKVAAARDPRAFEELYQAFGPRVKSYLLRQGADAATAEEIAQETLLVVWRKAGLFSAERGGAATWIFTIARNLRIDRIRREVPWQEYVSEEHEEADDAPLPDETVASGEVSVRVLAALDELPADQLEVVRLSYIDGLSHSEIAERLALPLGTVKSRMRLAYQKMREAFEDLQ